MSCPAQLDCSSDTALVDFDVKSNPDIAGPGVIIGFVGNAYLSLFVLLLYYLISFDPHQNPFSEDDEPDDTADWWKPNPVDTWILSRIRRCARAILKFLRLDILIPENPRALGVCFTSSVVHMCDLQLLTGISILVSGYVDVRCGFSAYHWQIVVYLAWFSSVTHLSGLTSVRHTGHAHSLERIPRTIFSTIFFVMLVTAMVPTGYLPWSSWAMMNEPQMFTSVACLFDPRRAPALAKSHRVQDCMETAFLYAQGDTRTWCQDQEDRLSLVDTVDFQAMVFSVLLLTFGFLTRLIKLWKPLQRFFFLFVQRPLTRLLQRMLFLLERRYVRDEQTIVSDKRQEKGLSYFLINRPITAWLLFARMNVDCLTSFTSELLWLMLLLLWGTLRLAITQSVAQRSPTLQEETQWTFGQTLPVLLLVGPILMVVRSFTTNVATQRQVLQVMQLNRREAVQPSKSATVTTWSIAHPDIDKDVPNTLILRSASTLRLFRSATTLSENRNYEILSPDFYADNIWIGTCITACYMFFTFITCVNFVFSLQSVTYTILDVWISSFRLLLFVLLYYPLAIHASILFGFAHDDHCAHSGRAPGCKHKGWLRFGIIFLTLVFMVLYLVVQLSILTIWPYVDNTMGWPFDARPGPYAWVASLIMTAIPFVLSGVCYIGYAIYVLSRRRR